MRVQLIQLLNEPFHSTEVKEQIRFIMNAAITTEDWIQICGIACNNHTVYLETFTDALFYDSTSLEILLKTLRSWVGYMGNFVDMPSVRTVVLKKAINLYSERINFPNYLREILLEVLIPAFAKTRKLNEEENYSQLVCLSTLGDEYLQIGQTNTAEQYYSEAINLGSIKEEMLYVGGSAAVWECLYLKASTILKKSMLYQITGEQQKAKQYQSIANDIFFSLQEAAPNVKEFKIGLERANVIAISLRNTETSDLKKNRAKVLPQDALQKQPEKNIEEVQNYIRRLEELSKLPVENIEETQNFIKQCIHLADEYSQILQYAKAYELLEFIRKLCFERHNRDKNSLFFAMSLGVTYGNLAQLNEVMQQPDEAFLNYITALNIFNDLFKVYPTNLSLMQALSSCYFRLGILYEYKDDLSKAEDNFKKCVIVTEKLIQLLPLSDEAKFNCAGAYEGIGNIHYSAKERSITLEYYTKSLNLLRECHPAYPENGNYKMHIAIVLDKLVPLVSDIQTACEHVMEAQSLFYELIQQNNGANRKCVGRYCYTCYELAFLLLDVNGRANPTMEQKEGNIKVAIYNLDYCLKLLDWLKEESPLNQREQELYNNSHTLLNGLQNE